MRWWYWPLLVLGCFMLVGGIIYFLVQDNPAFTEQQVISRVQVYGVSNLGGSVSPVGQWAAVYEGDGRWRVSGQVVKSHSVDYVVREEGRRFERFPEQETSYHATTWIHTNDEIRLLEMED